jgi:Myb-like DNA-binding domain
MIDCRNSLFNTNGNPLVSVLTDCRPVGIESLRKKREPVLIEMKTQRSDNDGDDDLSVSTIGSFRMPTCSPRNIDMIKNVLDHFRTDGEVELYSCDPEMSHHTTPPTSPLTRDKRKKTVPILRVTFERDEIQNHDNRSTDASSREFPLSLEVPMLDQSSSIRRQATRGSPVTNSNNKNYRPWTPTDDALLRKHVESVSTNVRNRIDFWEMLSQRVFQGFHSAVECRERSATLLLLEEHPWTEEEDRVILKHFGALASNWTTILANLPRRSERSIKNRCRKFYLTRQKLLADKPQLVEALKKRRRQQQEQQQNQKQVAWWQRSCEVGLPDMRQIVTAERQRKRLKRPDYDQIGREKEIELFQNDDWMNW